MVRQLTLEGCHHLHLSASRYLAFDYVERLSLEDQDGAICKLETVENKSKLTLGTFVPRRKMDENGFVMAQVSSVAFVMFCHVLLNCSV